MPSILVVAPYARWLPHWETDLEIAQRHLDAGDHVTLLVCNRDLPACDANPDHRYLRCSHCMGRQREGVRLLNGRLVVEPVIARGGLDAMDALPVPDLPNTIEELRRVVMDNFDLGWASLSSLVSWTRDPEPNLDNADVKAALQRAVGSGVLTYQSIRARLRSESYDLVYVFNGRTAVTRAVVRACEAEGVPYRTHDRGCDFNHFEVFEGRLPQDLRGIRDAIRTAWENGIEPERSRVGGQFFEERRLGMKQNWVSYTKRQKKGNLPDDWDGDKANIVVFVSSDDELVAIGQEWMNPIYRTQVDGLERIVASLAGDRRHHVYIRMHPSQAGNRSAAVKRFWSLAAENVRVIPPASPVSSYALLDGAARVLSFGSTMGIEAAFWGKASIVAGRSAFESLGSTYEPLTHDEVVGLLLDPKLRPLPRAGALAYGYYEQTRGERFRYFEGTDVWEGKFKGREIGGGGVFGAIAKAKRLLSVGHQ